MDSTQPRKHRWNWAGWMAAKTRLRVSWEGMPLSSLSPSRSRNQSSLESLSELSHADEVIGSADGGADDDEDDGHELVLALEWDAWVAEVGKVVGEGSRGGCHDNAPKRWSGTLSDQTSECARGGV